MIPEQRRTRRFAVVSGNVVALGFTSLFTDISSEMVNSVLPLYLAFQLGFTPFQIGGFDGAYQAVAVLTAFFGAFAADRSNRHKESRALDTGCPQSASSGFSVLGLRRS